MARFEKQLRSARRDLRRSRGKLGEHAVLPLTDSIEALGATCRTDEVVDVPTERIVGTIARQAEFDRAMRPLRPHLGPR